MCLLVEVEFCLNFVTQICPKPESNIVVPPLAFKIPTCTKIPGRRDWIPFFISLIPKPWTIVCTNWLKKSYTTITWVSFTNSFWFKTLSHTYCKNLIFVSRMFPSYTHWDKTHSNLSFQDFGLGPNTLKIHRQRHIDNCLDDDGIRLIFLKKKALETRKNHTKEMFSPSTILLIDEGPKAHNLILLD